MGEVSRTVTPINEADGAACLIAAYRAVMGDLPEQSTAALLLAQIFLETNNGKSMVANNPGNLTVNTSGPPDFTVTSNADYWRPPWFAEPTDATGAQVGWNNVRNEELHKKMLAGKAPAAFASYATRELGFRTYVDWLKRKFPSIIKAAKTGDPDATAKAIKASGYCPDCEPVGTAKTLRLLAATFTAKGLFRELPLVPPVFRGAAGSLSGELSSSSPSGSSPALFVAKFARDLPTLHIGAFGSAVFLFGWLTGLWLGEEYGEKEAEAARAWQAKGGLKDDAVIGKLTWRKAVELANSARVVAAWGLPNG